jgi:3-methyladenine DNA glycosylase AlkC
MPEPLKNIYTPEFVAQLCSSWKALLPDLNAKQFAKSIFEDNWTVLELKQRMSRLAEVTAKELPSDFKVAGPLLRKMITQLVNEGAQVGGFEYMFVPEIVLNLGIEHWKESMITIEFITKHTSCEFAIRPFILKYEERTMQQMLQWSTHSHQNVRRLSSEGCRSRLPWSMALPRFKKDATLLVPILENLKADDSLFVRKSVANNLNDISKDLPDLALLLAKKWYGKNDSSNWIVKHGMRTLLKSGNPRAMALFGYADVSGLALSSFELNQREIDFGESISFNFTIENKTTKSATVRLEYAVYLMKKNGRQTKKVFKITERDFRSNEKLLLSKIHPFKPINTRKYYSGEHGIALVINGTEFKKHSFLLNI